MPAPPQCQLLVDEIDQLEGQIVEVGELVGEARWKAVAKNVNIRQQVADKQQKLKACLIAFGGFSTQVVVLNLTAGGGGAVTQPLSGTLWRLSAFASPVENQTVQGGQLSFLNGPCDPLGALLAISVDEAPNATFTGRLFRSGAMETLYDGNDDRDRAPRRPAPRRLTGPALPGSPTSTTTESACRCDHRPRAGWDAPGRRSRSGQA
jgi:hypothetical protein